MKLIGWLFALTGLVIVLGATFGAGLLWIIPGMVIKDRTNRSAVAALNWLTWLGPFGLIPLVFGKPLPTPSDPGYWDLPEQPKPQAAVPPPPPPR